MPEQRRACYVLLIVSLCLVSSVSIFSTEGPKPIEAAPAAQDWPDCSLLDDPERRGMLSVGFELSLLEACGRLPHSPVLPSELSGSTIPDVVPAGGLDTRVNGIDPPDITSTQSETTLAVNANTGTICVAYNDIYHHLENQGIAGFSRSMDSGVTWQDGGSFPIGPGNIRSRGDPSLAWRALDGFFYYASLDDHGGGPRGLSIWRSTDDCASFQWLVEVSYSGSDDKELLAIDNNPASPYYRRIHLAWLVQTDRLYYFTYSDDGLNWSTPVLISDPAADYVAGAWPVVAPNGDIYVGWVRWDGFPDGPMDQEMVRSTDGGDSFSPVANPLDNAVVPRDPRAREYCGISALNGFIRYLPSLQIAISPGASGEPEDYCLHATYPYDPDGYNVGDVINVYYRRSCDHGASWGPEILLNDDGGLTDQFYPTIAANEDGVVAVSWYDRRNDPGTNYFYERWATVSYDGGDSWEPNRRIGDAVSPVFIDTLSSCNHGDYDMMVADQDYVYSVWVDDRIYFNGHFDQDIWFDKLPLWPDFVMEPEVIVFDLCRPDVATATVDLGVISFYNQPVTLNDSGVPVGVSTTFDPNPITPLPGSSVYTVDVTAGADTGSHTWSVTGESSGLSHEISVTLFVNSAVPGTLALVAPPDGAGEISLGHIFFAWNDLPEATSYHLQVDNDPNFGSPEADISGIETNSYNLAGQLDPATTYYWRVRAVNGCGDGAFSGANSFTTKTSCLLLVDDDDNDPDVREYYEDALNRLGYAYDVFDVGGGTGNGPTLAELEDYPIVIWFSGDKFNGGAGPNPTDEANLAAYLSGEGRLFLSSQDYLADYGLTPFGQSYLGIGWYTNNGGDDRLLYGDAGDPIGAGMDYFPSYPSQYYRHPDTVVPAAGVSSAFRDKNNNTVDIDKDGGAWKTAFFGSSWETTFFINEVRGTELLNRILDWFGGCAVAPVIAVEPLSLEAALYADEQVTRTVWISNVGTSDLVFTLNELSRTLTTSVPEDIPWLSEEPISGTVAPGEGMSIDVIFNSAGLAPNVYRGQLDVESNDPLTPTVSIPVTLTVGACDPVAGTSLSWVPINPIAGHEITFTAEATGTEPISFAWAFGDGSTGAGRIATHTFASSGIYTVTLTATNACGVEVVSDGITVAGEAKVYLPVVLRGR
jgi:hypothetical protein